MRGLVIPLYNKSNGQTTIDKEFIRRTQFQFTLCLNLTIESLTRFQHQVELTLHGTLPIHAPEEYCARQLLGLLSPDYVTIL